MVKIVKRVAYTALLTTVLASCSGVGNNTVSNDPEVDANINRLDSIITVEKDYIAKAKSGDMDASVKINELQYEGKQVVAKLKEQAASGKVKNSFRIWVGHFRRKRAEGKENQYG